MTSTTHSTFDSNTEALEVAKAFPNSIKNKTVLVTGVNLKGIGFSAAEALASQSPARVILAGRNVSKLQECIDDLKTKYPDVDYRPLRLNLSSQKDVRAAADELLSWNDVPAVNIVINSAGVMNLPERTLSEDGIEMQFAINHIGHFLFASLIMSKLITAAQNSPKGSTRIVNVSALAVGRCGMRWSDMTFEKLNKDLPMAEQPPYELFRAWGAQDPETLSYFPLDGYARSKVANLLFSLGANKRLYEKHGILSFAVHPGVIKTELSRNAPPEIQASIIKMGDTGVFTYRSLGAGAATQLVAATDPALKEAETREGKENVGSFLADCQISLDMHPLACSSAEAEKLWELSEKLVKQNFEW